MDNRKHHNAPPWRKHPAPAPTMAMYRAFAIYVTDGDTHEYLVEDPLDLHGMRSVRIRPADIDTWENFGINRDPVRGPLASRAAADLLGIQEVQRYEYSFDNPVYVELHLRKFNRERQIGRIFLPMSEALADHAEHALKMDGTEWISIAHPLRAGGHEKTTDEGGV